MERKISKIFTPLSHRTLVKGDESREFTKEKRDKEQRDVEVSKGK